MEKSQHTPSVSAATQGSDAPESNHNPNPKASEGLEEKTKLLLCLRPGSLGPQAKALLLRGGDALVAVNRTSLAPGNENIRELFEQARGGGDTVLLTFNRRCERFSVLATSSDLGQWDLLPEPITDIEPKPSNDPTVDEQDGLDHGVNWEIFRDMQHHGDLHPVRASILAAVLPTVWLMQMRIWPALGAVVLVSLFSYAISVLLFATTYALISAYVWRARLSLLRNDRSSRGMLPWMVVAARSETEAQETCLRFDPKLRFAFYAAQS